MQREPRDSQTVDRRLPDSLAEITHVARALSHDRVLGLVRLPLESVTVTHSLNADDEAERRLITTIINVAGRHRMIALHAPSLMSAKLRVSTILRDSSAADPSQSLL